MKRYTLILLLCVCSFVLGVIVTRTEKVKAQESHYLDYTILYHWYEPWRIEMPPNPPPHVIFKQHLQFVLTLYCQNGDGCNELPGMVDRAKEEGCPPRN